MVRRIFLWLLPAVLALTFAAPMGGARAMQATTFEQSANCGAASAVITPIHQDEQTVSGSQWTDEDDDRISPTRTSIGWVSIAFPIRSREKCDALCCVFVTSAAFPRGPPSA